MPKFPEWTDVRYFLEVARTEKVTLAAERLQVEHSTVSRRIDRLEHQLGTVLFDRRRNGYVLTDAGRALVPHAEAMESALLDAMDETRSNANEVAGTVRVGTLEAFGICVLAPRLGPFRALHPNLHVELMAQPQFPSLATREVEILVTVEPPQVGRYKVARLLDMNYYLYGSPEYLASRPPIRDMEDVATHEFVDYVHDGLMSERFRFLQEVVARPKRAFSSTSILAQREAAAAGMGLVLLTPYVVGARSDLVSVFPGNPQVTRTLWLAAPEDLFKIRRVRLTWDYIRQLVLKEPQLFEASTG
ncbi:LysR family transcriptional regulator [Xylophilus sp. GW821-FHT01B05]